MKRILSACMFAMLLLTVIISSVGTVSAASTNQVVVSADPEATYTGIAKLDKFEVTVSYDTSDSSKKVAGYDVTVQWDADVFKLADKYISEVNDSSCAACSNRVVIDTTGGELRVIVAEADNFITGSAVLFKLYLVPLKTADNSKLKVAVNSFASAEGPSMKPYTEGCSVTVKEGEGFIRGDVDGNGKVESKDYVKLKRYVLGTYKTDDEKEIERMNVDQKGGVDSKDYVMLKRVVLGTFVFKD